MKLIGKKSISEIKSHIARCGQLRILLTGETGVGKTPFAKYSNESIAPNRPFEHVNCAGLSYDHFQDQMFGHKKGAFTGAISDKKGFVELAENGDLFLDEIGEMPLESQGLLLTFLDTLQYYKLGEDRKRRANIRIICATNRNLQDMVERGTFRKDLYSRIAQVEIMIPSLRDRREDIFHIVRYFIELFTGYQKPYEKEVMDSLIYYDWRKGNVRELKDAVEYMCVMSHNSDTIKLEHLRKEISSFKDNVLNFPIIPHFDLDLASHFGIEKALDDTEGRIISHYFAKYKCVDRLSSVLKMSKPTCYRRLKKYRLIDET